MGSVEKRIENVVFTKDSVDTLNILLPLDIRQITVEGRVTNIEGDPVPTVLELTYSRPGLDQITATDTTETDGRFRFDGPDIALQPHAPCCPAAPSPLPRA